MLRLRNDFLVRSGQVHDQGRELAGIACGPGAFHSFLMLPGIQCAIGKGVTEFGGGLQAGIVARADLRTWISWCLRFDLHEIRSYLMNGDASSVQQIGPDHLSEKILAAVVSVVARDGFEGATIRRVAARAGCSAGAVQKRFATRTQLLRAAFEHVVSTVYERMSVEAQDCGTGLDTLLERQRLGALETLPLDSERREESLVWTSYLLRAAVDESLGDLPRRLDKAVHDALTEDLAAAQSRKELRSEVDPSVLADAVLALIDGIAIRMLYTPPAEHDTLLAAMDLGLKALLAD